jgi:hypothetical protein
MKNLYKYLFFLVLGIIIFIVYNTKDGFSVGIPVLYTKRGDRNIYYSSNEQAPIDADYNIINLDGTGIVPTNDIIQIPFEQYNELLSIHNINNPDNPFITYVIGQPGDLITIPIVRNTGGIPGMGGLPIVPGPSGLGSVDTLGGGGGAPGDASGGASGGGSLFSMRSSCASTSQGKDIYIIAGNHIEKIISGYYSTSRVVNLAEEQFQLVWKLLQKCTDEEGEQVASILKSDNKDKFLRDLSRNIKYNYDTPEESSIRYQGLINYYTSNSFTIDNLRDYGLDYTLVYQDGNFSIYRLTIVNPDIYNLNQESIRNLYVISGNSRQTFAFPDSHHTTYMFTEGQENFIRGRLNYGNNATDGVTIFPVGHGYGSIFFRMLYESEEDVVIKSLRPEVENISAYRRLFRLSVTPNSRDSNGFVEDNEFNFTIFRPDNNLIRLLYPRYNDLYTHINPVNREHFNLFLMSLNEDILTENLFSNFRPDILKLMYDDF